jgi:hypothetical protein
MTGSMLVAVGSSTMKEDLGTLEFHVCTSGDRDREIRIVCSVHQFEKEKNTKSKVQIF